MLAADEPHLAKTEGGRLDVDRAALVLVQERDAVTEFPAVLALMLEVATVHVPKRGDEPLEAATAPAAQTATGQSAQSSLGFRAAFRGSFGVAPIRDDLRQLPRLLRTRAFFVPLAAIAVTTIAAM